MNVEKVKRDNKWEIIDPETGIMLGQYSREKDADYNMPKMEKELELKNKLVKEPDPNKRAKIKRDFRKSMKADPIMKQYYRG